MATEQVGIRLALSGAEQVVSGLGQVAGKLGDLDAKSLRVGAALSGVGAALGAALSIGSVTAFIKHAIDAGDETFNLAQKVGVAARDVAGLQLSFKQAGVDGGAMQTALVKLSRNVVDNSDSFSALGIKVRGAGGELKGSKAVLYEIADKFKDMPDGIQKTALATEFFGKAGADLIPLLNDGSEGLAAMATMAEKLGLVIDDQTARSADEFNDTLELLGMGMQGVGRQVAAQLLPTLTNLAGSFLKTMTDGDSLARAAAVLATALKGLFSAGVAVAEVFNTVGKVLGGVAAAAVSAISGDFSGARAALSAMRTDITEGWTKSGTAISAVWSDTADSSVVAAARIVGSGHTVVGAHDLAGKSAAALAAAQKKAREQAEAYAEAGLKVAQSLSAQDLGLSGDFNEKLDKLGAAYRAGKLTLDELRGATRLLMEQQPYHKALIKEQEAAELAMAKATNELTLAELKQADSLAEQVDKQREHNATIGKTTEELAALEQAKLADALATAEQRLQAALLGPVDVATLEALTLQVEGLRELKRLKAEGVIQQATVDTAKAAAEAWAKTSDSIGQGLTDSLFRAFESGKGFFKTLWDGVVNTFKTTVLQPTIRGILAPVTGALGSLFSGGASAAGAASGAGGLGSLGSLGSLASLGASLGTFGTAAGYGLSAAFGGTAMTAIGGGASMIGAGSVASGAGMMLGAAAPYLLAAAAIYSLLSADHNANLGFGSTTGKREFDFGRGTDVGSQDQLASIAQAVLSGTSGTAALLGGHVGPGLAVQAATDIDRKGHGSGTIQFVGGSGARLGGVQTGGTNPLATAATKLDDAGKLGDWFAANTSAAIVAGLQQSDLPARFRDFFGGVAASGLSQADAQAMLATAQGVKGLTDALAPLGGVFGQLGGLSVQATASLAALTGGFDQFVSKANDYVAAFYSEGERAAISAAQLRDALAAAGLDANISTKAEFRALVDRQDLSSAAGQQGLAALLNVAGSFAGVADYLATSGQTLAQLADQAPQVALLEQAQTQTDVAQQTVDGIAQLGDGIQTIGTNIVGAVSALQASVEAGLAATAAAANATTRLLSSWDNGGAMITTPDAPP